MPHAIVTRATRRDCDQVFDLVNLAFKCEIGKTGVAYKKCNRYRLKDATRKHIDDMWVIKENRRIVGCVRGVTHNGVTEIGPIAVHPDYQGQGFGKQLMATAEAKGKGEKYTVGIVSCRTDVIPFFEKLGYQQAVTKSIQEIGKLYPDDLCEKLITRNDIEFTILVKKKA